MAARLRLLATFAVLFLTLHPAFSADPPESPPSPAPEADSVPKSSPPVNPPVSSPPDSSSPPAHPPTTEPSGSLSPSPAPETSPHHLSPSPSPSPSPAADSDDEAPPSPAPSADFRAADSTAKDTPEKESSGGMSGAKKAGIAVGVLIGVGLVVLAGIIYKKRQDNVQRSQYGYATRAGLI